MAGYAEVLLPLPVPGTFSYQIPEDLQMQVKPGIRVVVQFGSRKIYAGLVTELIDSVAEGINPREILSVIDEKPVVTENQFRFWEWMSEYYLCTPGEVMNAALPSALKLSSESKLMIRPEASYQFDELQEKEQLLLEALEIRKKLPVSEVPKIIGQMKALPVIKTLIDRGILVMEEELQQKYRPKTETLVELMEPYLGDENELHLLFDKLEKKAPRQLEALMTWVQLSKFGQERPVAVTRTQLVEKSGVPGTILDKMAGKMIFSLQTRLADPGFRKDSGEEIPVVAFSEDQNNTLQEILTAFEVKEVVLLHGVTSSGKTELYIELIRQALLKGKQVLYLLPEIALTTQIIRRLKRYFGDRVGVYHSRFSDNERVDIWNSRYDIILGARSAIFLPFQNLGLIIVDEEHDTSFKQMDPAPRYHGRDAAIYLAGMFGAKTLLGSATPSLESYFNAKSGKYALAELFTRYGDVELPRVQIVNLREEIRRGTLKSHFSSVLLTKLEEAFRRGEQTILFQNRRGFSLRLECEICQWMPTCKNCDVTLVYHKKSNQLRCHYCGFVSRIPENCPQCHNPQLTMKGFGTEKIEEELALMFPDRTIARLDLDTTRAKHAYRQIISDFEDGRIDVLVGTQMVTKGLDFDRVSTVCVLNADNMLSFPDFRAAERSFQLMAQVSGRSGRKDKQGQVIIQTYNPGHPVLRDVVTHDFTSMYLRQIAERRKFNYPPFCRLILIRVKHRDLRKTVDAAATLAHLLRKSFGTRVLGPEFPLVARIMNFHIQHIMLKMERDPNLRDQKMLLRNILAQILKNPGFAGVRLIADADPV